jgi:hypothetical protein
MNMFQIPEDVQAFLNELERYWLFQPNQAFDDQ